MLKVKTNEGVAIKVTDKEKILKINFVMEYVHIKGG